MMWYKIKCVSPLERDLIKVLMVNKKTIQIIPSKSKCLLVRERERFYFYPYDETNIWEQNFYYCCPWRSNILHDLCYHTLI